VSKWETEKSFPEVTLIPKIADLLGTTVNELLVEKEQNKLVENKQKGDKGSLEIKKEILAKRTGIGIDIVFLILSTISLILFFAFPSKDGIGIGNIIKDIYAVFVLLFVIIIYVFTLIKNIKTPKIVIGFNGEKIEVYNKKGEIRYIELNQIKSVWISIIGEIYAGRLKIFLNNGECLVFYSIIRPSITKGKIEALKSYRR